VQPFHVFGRDAAQGFEQGLGVLAEQRRPLIQIIAE
jgi:hypothetical protein